MEIYFQFREKFKVVLKNIYLVLFVCLVYLVCLVCLVYLVKGLLGIPKEASFWRADELALH